MSEALAPTLARPGKRWRARVVTVLSGTDATRPVIRLVVSSRAAPHVGVGPVGQVALLNS